MAVHKAWYYDWTEDRQYAQDPTGESNLAWLCDECAEQAGDEVSWAGEDSDYEHPCWHCGREEADDPDDRPDWWLETDYEDRVCGRWEV